MNISRTKLGKYIKANNLKAGDSILDFIVSVSDATHNKWVAANWIANKKGHGAAVTSYAIEQLTSGSAEPKIDRPWSPENIPSVEDREEAVRIELVKEMTKRGFEFGTYSSETYQGKFPLTNLNGIPTGFYLNAERGSLWSRKPSTKLRIRYGGDYNIPTQQRPEPNEGFDLKLICNDLEQLIERRTRAKTNRDLVKARLQASTKLADDINTRLDIKYGKVKCEGTSVNAHKVRVKIDLNLTPENAEVLLKLAQKMENAEALLKLAKGMEG